MFIFLTTVPPELIVPPPYTMNQLITDYPEAKLYAELIMSFLWGSVAPIYTTMIASFCIYRILAKVSEGLW